MPHNLKGFLRKIQGKGEPKFEVQPSLHPEAEASKSEKRKESDNAESEVQEHPDLEFLAESGDDVYKHIAMQRASEEETGPIYITSSLRNDKDSQTVSRLKSAVKTEALRNEIRSLLSPDELPSSSNRQPEPTLTPTSSEPSRHPIRDDVDSDNYGLFADIGNVDDSDPLREFDDDPDSISSLEFIIDGDPLKEVADSLVRESMEKERKREKLATADSAAATKSADPIAPGLVSETSGDKRKRRQSRPALPEAVAGKSVTGDRSTIIDESGDYLHRKKTSDDDANLDSTQFQTTQTRIAKQLDRLNGQLNLQGSMIYTMDGLVISMGEIPASGELGKFAMNTLMSIREQGAFFRMGLVRSLDFSDREENHVLIHALDPQRDKAVLLVWSHGIAPLRPVEKFLNELLPILDQWLAQHGL